MEPMKFRSLASVVMATAQPLFSPPRMCSWGTRASVKNTSLKWAPPFICFSGRTSTPGWSMSNRK